MHRRGKNAAAPAHIQYGGVDARRCFKVAVWRRRMMARCSRHWRMWAICSITAQHMLSEMRLAPIRFGEFTCGGKHQIIFEIKAKWDFVLCAVKFTQKANEESFWLLSDFLT